MGYTTDFTGCFEITPPLNTKQVAYLQAFSQSRREARNPLLVQAYPDPIREAVELPVGPQGAYFVGAVETINDLFVVGSHRPEGQPGFWCQWTPTLDGAHLEWDGGEKFYNYTEWLTYLVEHFFKLWGSTLNGCVQWQGEEDDDTGVLGIIDNRVVVCAEFFEYEAQLQRKRLSDETDAIAQSKSSTAKTLKI